MKVLIKAGLLVFILLISAQIGYSCTCVQRDIKEEFNATNYIFVGKVIEITEDKTYTSSKLDNISPFSQKITNTGRRYLIKFKVKNKFKGVMEDEITLVKYEYKKESPCGGLSFRKHKTYLIYAVKNEEKEEISDKGMCSRTRHFDKKSEDYRKLLRLKA